MNALQQRARMLKAIDGREPCYFCVMGEAHRVGGRH